MTSANLITANTGTDGQSWMWGTGGDLDDTCSCSTNATANDCKDQCGVCNGDNSPSTGT